jgi:SapC protein
MQGWSLSMTHKTHHDYQTVSPEQHGALTWHPPRNFSFAADWPLIPLMERELRTVSGQLPIAFHRTQNEWRVVALSGGVKQGNTCIDTRNKWRQPYIPASIRSYPFKLGEGARAQLCIDENSGLLDTSYGGHPFFDANGVLSPRLKTIRRFLRQCEAERQMLMNHAHQLARLTLLEPWKEASAVTGISGLHRANLKQLQKLPPERFVDLQSPGLLQLLFGQSLSETFLGLVTSPPDNLTENTTGSTQPRQLRSSTESARQLIQLMQEEMSEN